MLSPACEAAIVQLPVPVMCTVLAVTVQLPFALKLTARPEDAVALTVTLFRTIGAKRTRLIAQIVAAVIGSFLRAAPVIESATSGSTQFFQALGSADSGGD